MSKIKKTLFVVLVLNFPTNANAYIDPGSLNLILSVIVSILLTLGIFFKDIYLKAKSFFKVIFKKSKKK